MVQVDYLRPNTNVVVTCIKETMDGSTCIVQDEFPEEFLHTVPDTHIFPSIDGVVIGTEVAMEGATCIIQEDFPTAVPPSLNKVDECDQTPPNLFSLE
jgi:hypothetical protein